MRMMPAPTRSGAAQSGAQLCDKPFIWPFLAVIWIVTASTSAEDGGNEFTFGSVRQQPPSPAAIEDATAELREVYSRRDIVANLPKLVNENQSQPARVHAMISMAAEEFLAREQFGRALDCYKDLSQRFEFDWRYVALKAFATSHEVVKKLKLPIEKREASEALFVTVENLIKELMAQEDYTGADEACQLLEAIQQTARAVRTKRADELSRAVEAARARVQSGKKAFEMVPAAKLRLQASEQDSDALEILGLYSCLYGNDWRTGLERLRKVQPGSLRVAAMADTNASTFLGLSGEDAYAVAKAWKQVASDDKLFGSESLWMAAQDSVLQRELEWLDRAIQLDIDNEIDRKLAWGRQNQLQRALGVDPHAIVGTWRILTNEPAWKKTFQTDGQLIARHPNKGVVSGTWRPEGSARAVVVTEHDWKWQCTIEDGSKQLLIEEFDPKGKKKYSVLHKPE